MMQFRRRVICVTHSRMHPFIVLLCVSFTRGALIGPRERAKVRETQRDDFLNKLIFIDHAAFQEREKLTPGVVSRVMAQTIIRK
jgi:hypothetical protein